MFDDQPLPSDTPRTGENTPAYLGEPLAPLSLDDLKARREDLHKEIARVDAEIANKTSGRAAAEAIFNPQ